MSNEELLDRLKEIQEDLQDGFKENALAKLRDLREDLGWEEGQIVRAPWAPRAEDSASPEGGPVSTEGVGLPAL